GRRRLRANIRGPPGGGSRRPFPSTATPQVSARGRGSVVRPPQGPEPAVIPSVLFGRGRVKLVDVTAHVQTSDRGDPGDRPADVVTARERAVNPLQRLILGRL